MKVLVPWKRTVVAGCTILFFFLFSSAQAATSPDGLWQSADPVDVTAARGGNDNINVNPGKYRAFSLNRGRMQAALASAPAEQPGVSPGAAGAPLVLHLPMPDNRFMAFHVVETSVMAPELAEKFPEIRTYTGTSVDDSSIRVNLDLTPAGFHAQVLMAGQRWYIDPLYKDNSQLHASYFREDASGEVHRCLVESVSSARPLMSSARSSGDVLRTYRLAVATTGEYGAFTGGTTSSALAAVVTTMNRVNGIYERELSIRMVLVGNNDTVVFVDPASDPFAGNFNAGLLIGESQSVIDSLIGSANYDIGHTFSTGGGGLAGLGVVCAPGNKASGITGRSNPVGDPFDVDYVAHEIGHQFGANHTFNSPSGSCSGNRNTQTAYEPGSGSTILAYAGICGADDLQPNSDAIFHSASFDEITAYVVGGGACGVQTPTGNAIPQADAAADFTIPANTPFVMRGLGSDTDGDPLAYLWEQRDLGPSVTLTAPDNGTAPLFRVFTPDNAPARYLPRLSQLVTNAPDNKEKLPTAARTMKWRMTVRDGNGGVQSDDAQLTVSDTAGPFAVTSPNGGENLSGVVTVTWDVANTDAAPVSTPSVDIFLSLDGGLTFDLDNPLVANTPNDGVHDLVLPNDTQNQARFMVKGRDNVFFDISNGDIAYIPHDAGKTLANNVWQMISLPSIPPAGANTIDDIIGDDLPGDYGVGWIVYAFDPIANDYTMPGPDGVMQPGVGYWVLQISGSAQVIDMPAGSTLTTTTANAGSQQCSATEGCIDVALTAKSSTQWNMVGNPFYTSPAVDSMRVSTSGGICGDADGCSIAEAANQGLANVQHNSFWTYDGAAYVEVGPGMTWQPWTGYWNPVLPGGDGLDPVMHIPRT